MNLWLVFLLGKGKSALNNSGGGTVFKMTPTGALTTLVSF